ncbi:HNH endonuclease [Chryseoglobus sp. 28M-23]|uniref:HNH endonuclease n=1 Tax=Chryseoglobus sp. 28M-23 TaxID=2772253 RepID=UPI001CD0C662
MVTSRTGLATHINWRKRVLHRDRTAGVTHCPCTEPCRHHPLEPCGVKLDYDVSRQPHSAEPDHIKPFAYGGENTLENGRTICRRCNAARGKGTKPPTPRPPITASPIW